MMLNQRIRDLVSEFERKSGLKNVRHTLVEKPIRSVLFLHVANPTDRYYEILESVVTSSDIEDHLAVSIKASSAENLIDAAEGQYLLRILSEIQNVNRYTFEHDFFQRYTMSVSGAEAQIVANSNHVVWGRRGAGKSMLLLYAWHTRRHDGVPSVWIDMQVYSSRSDVNLIADVLAEIIEQSGALLRDPDRASDIARRLTAQALSIEEIRRLLPSIRRFLSTFASRGQELFIFLDDLHVIGEDIQSVLLDVVYAVCRGNKLFLKISAIETLTKTFNSVTNEGVEIPQDAQNIRLDYNLTMPERATTHIEAILNSHASYAGIKSIRRLCVSNDVMPRLTWVAAGVPRDALNIFAQAMTKASVEGRKRVSVSNINVAASETLSIKLRDLDTDATANAAALKSMLETVRDFCITKTKSNAFLVEVGANPKGYELLMKLIHLRLLHVISEGITVGRAGRKYLGLILDYGFYTGIRAAQSVELFNRQSGKVAYKDLRALDIFVPT